MLNHLVVLYRASAARRHITVTAQLDPTLPLVSGDPLALEQIFANLMSNALKFTPDSGRIGIETWFDDPQVGVTIVNSGAGIAPEELPSLFQRYGQTAAGRATSGGTGMGLFIVKSLVEAHGGTVSATSIPGTETRFVVILPALKDGERGA